MGGFFAFGGRSRCSPLPGLRPPIERDSGPTPRPGTKKLGGAAYVSTPFLRQSFVGEFPFSPAIPSIQMVSNCPALRVVVAGYILQSIPLSIA